MNAPSQPQDVPVGRWLALVIGVAALARLILIGDESYWFDEIWAVKQVRGPLVDVLASLAREDVHPPLYPITLWAWIRLVGEAEWATRLLSAIAGTGAVAATWGLGRALFGRQTGLVAAGLLALNAYAVFYSQESRCYSLMLCLATLATWALVRWHQDPTRRRAVIYGVSAIFLAYVHVFGLFVLLAHGLWAVWCSPLRWRMVGVGVVVGVAFSPWLPVMLGQVGRVQEGFWIDPLTWTDPIKWLWYWSGYNVPMLVVFVGLVARGFRRMPSESRRLLGLVATVPVLIPVVLSLVGEPIFHHKYPIAILAPLMVAAGHGLVGIAPSIRRWLAPAVVVLLVGGLVWTVYLKVDKEQYREVAEIARADVAAGRLIISESGMRPYIGYYLDGDLVVWLDDGSTMAELAAHPEAASGVTYLLVHPSSTEREARFEATFERAEVIELRSARVIRYRLRD